MNNQADPDSTLTEKLLDRIRKLYAMSQEVEASPNEAEIALRRCTVLFPALFQQPFLFPIRLRRGLFSRFGTDAQDKVGRWLTGLAITRS